MYPRASCRQDFESGPNLPYSKWKARTLLILVALFLSIQAREDVMLSTSVNEDGSVPCSDKRVNITCIGSETNSMDIWFQPFGHHTYERTSQRLVMVGPVELELVEVTPDPNNNLLSTFHIEGRIQFDVNISSLMVTCSDGLSMKSLTLQLNSSQCFETISSTMQDAPCSNCNITAMTDLTSVLIDWEEPSCLGWEKIKTYNISVCFSSHCTFSETDVTEFCVCNLNKGNHTYTICATNVCGETTPLASSVFIVDPTDKDVSTSEMKDSLPVAIISVATVCGFIVVIVVVGVSVIGISLKLMSRKR